MQTINGLDGQHEETSGKSIDQYNEYLNKVNLLSAYDVISSHAIAAMQWPVYHAVIQVSLKICQLCFRVLKELRES